MDEEEQKRKGMRTKPTTREPTAVKNFTNPVQPLLLQASDYHLLVHRRFLKNVSVCELPVTVQRPRHKYTGWN